VFQGIQAQHWGHILGAGRGGLEKEAGRGRLGEEVLWGEGLGEDWGGMGCGGVGGVAWGGGEDGDGGWE